MKRILCLVLIFILLLPLCPLEARAAGLNVRILGTPLAYGSGQGAPYLAADGTPMVPVQATAEAMGVTVAPDDATGETLLQLGTKELRLKANSSTFTVNGCSVKLSLPTVSSGGVLYAPAAELVTGLGGFWSWADGVLDIDPQNQDYLMLRYERAPLSVSAGEFWTLWSSANQLRAAGSYAEAIAKYLRLLPGFTQPGAPQKNDTNAALAYGHLATCYIGSGSYDLAAAAYSRSSYYWGLSGDKETQLARYENARACRSELSLYLYTEDPALAQARTHNVAYEPERGIVLGYTSARLGASDSYPATSQKAAGMQLVYFNWDSDALGSKLSATDPTKVVELAVQPMQGFSGVQDSEIRSFAQELAASGRKVLVRYANEMNEPSTPWYAEPETYKAEFIRFARIMRQYAPGVPLIWAPNFWPITTMDSFYPGDEYVDYVGVSSYVSSYHYSAKEKSYGYDIFGDGLKTARWAQQLDYFYNHYGYKKPLLIAEGAASYIDIGNGNSEAADLAAEQLLEFYRYLPMRYPNLKYAVYFNVDNETRATKYMLSSRPQLAAAYNEATADSLFLSSYESSAAGSYVPFEALPAATAFPEGLQKLSAFVRYGNNTQVKALRYELDGVPAGTVNAAPYRAELALSGSGSGSAVLRVTALDAKGSALVSKRFRLGRPQSSPGVGFADVPEGKWYTEAVRWAVEQGVTSGVDATHFAPEDPCTREQVVTFLWRTAGKPAPAADSSPFADVTEGYYRDAVLWAVEQGITNGTAPDRFGVGGRCTRGEIVTFLWRAAGRPAPSAAGNPFRDVTPGRFYSDAVLWAVEQGITAGVAPGLFSPEEICTRAQVVTFLYRAHSLLFPAGGAG